MVIRKRYFETTGVTVVLDVRYTPYGKSGAYMAQTMFHAYAYSARLGVYIECVTPYAERGFERFAELLVKEFEYDRHCREQNEIRALQGVNS